MNNSLNNYSTNTKAMPEEYVLTPNQIMALRDRAESAEMRERAALEQARRARESVAELTQQFQAAELKTKYDNVFSAWGETIAERNAAQAQVAQLREVVSVVADTLELEAQKLDSFIATQETKSEKALKQGSLTKARSESTSAMPLMPVLLRREAKRLHAALSAAPESPPTDTARAEYVKALEAEHEFLRKERRAGNINDCHCNLCMVWAAVEAAKGGGR